MPELRLEGCNPEPLMSYLKALGVLRLVAEQADAEARGAWRDGVFVLESNLDPERLARFFLEQYRPTPIVVPWSGGDFFGVNRKPKLSLEMFSKTPTASTVIEAFLATKTERLSEYRCVILKALEVMDRLGITEKANIEGTSRKRVKAGLLARLRSALPDQFLPWLDVAAQLTQDSFSFNPLVGSGGGSDGNTHFSDNFMQNLWECLPDFDQQRTHAESPDIRSALFGLPARSLKPKRTASLYDSGAVGGPNAGVGMERESLLNPWDFVLALEGTLCLAGAVTKRQGASRAQGSAFPFAVRMTAVGFGSGVDKENGQNEIWLPFWSRSLNLPELRLLFANARSDIGRRVARTGLDFARAVASTGTDTGIHAFARYGIVRGRVGGENYNTAVFAGAFLVNRQERVGLIEQVDGWLDSFRRACRTKDQGAKSDPPSRFPTALRRIESAIFDYCRYGRPEDLRLVLITLGHAERELAVTAGQRGGNEMCGPMRKLSTAWLEAAHHDSGEFEIALALAGVRDLEDKIQPIRVNMEPVTFAKGRWCWQSSGPHVVWNAADLPTNMAKVLRRRILDGARAGCDGLPLHSRRRVGLDVIAAFLSGQVNDQRIEDLLWALVLLDHGQRYPVQVKRPRIDNVPALPRAYALLKLLFLPRPLVCGWDADHQKHRWRLARLIQRPGGQRTLEGGIRIRPEPRVLALLNAGRIGDACRIAYERLRSSGLKPLPHPMSGRRARHNDWQDIPCAGAQRLAAALLLPISNRSINEIVHLVARQDHGPEMITR